MSEVPPSHSRGGSEFDAAFLKERLRTLADERFADLYVAGPERAASADESAGRVLHWCKEMLQEDLQDDPAYPTLVAAAKKYMFLFSESAFGDEEQDYLERDAGMLILKQMMHTDGNIVEAANRADIFANWIMVAYLPEAKTRFSAWAALTPGRKLWFTQGYAEACYRRDWGGA